MVGFAIAYVKNNIILSVNFNINQQPKNLAISRLLTAFIMSAPDTELLCPVRTR